MVLLLPRSGIKYHVTDERSDYWIQLYVDNTLVRLFPDNGSELNLVSAEYVQRERLDFGNRVLDNDSKDIIQLPDGRFVESLGSLDLRLRFPLESEVLMARFTILSGCVHDFILGGPFLRKTQTLTTFKYRIQRSRALSQAPLRVCLNGAPQEQILGSINGHAVYACPDTGSDVNVIDRDYALALGLNTTLDPENTILEVVDGSHVSVRDIVRRAEWHLGPINQEWPYGGVSKDSVYEGGGQTVRFGPRRQRDRNKSAFQIHMRLLRRRKSLSASHPQFDFAV
jgi:hypothetical protein